MQIKTKYKTNQSAKRIVISRNAAGVLSAVEGHKLSAKTQEHFRQMDETSWSAQEKRRFLISKFKKSA